MSDGVIYAMADIEIQWLKLGITRNVERRLASLQQGVPFTLEVLIATSGTHQLERHLHGRMSSWRVRGEWYRYTQESWAAALGCMREIEDAMRRAAITPVESRHISSGKVINRAAF